MTDEKLDFRAIPVARAIAMAFEIPIPILPLSRPVQTPLERFHNTLRILHSIDLHELDAAGIELSREDWRMFRDMPADWFIRASDEDARKVWAIIEARQK